MQLDLAGKAALVTGSSRGIGRAIAAALYAEGCRVALNGRDEIVLRAAVAELSGTFPVPGDVSRVEQAKSVVDRACVELGRLDILVCNAGSGRSVPPGEENFDEWSRMIDANLRSATNVIEAARVALAATGGSIVCVSSICGAEVIGGAPVTYAVSKSALNAYVRGIARPFGKQGIRINAVAPGNILFDGSVWARRLAADPAAVREMLKRDVALERLGTPEDVANLVVYLASPRAAFATGAVWTLDGGQVHG